VQRLLSNRLFRVFWNIDNQSEERLFYGGQQVDINVINSYFVMLSTCFELFAEFNLFYGNVGCSTLMSDIDNPVTLL